MTESNSGSNAYAELVFSCVLLSISEHTDMSQVFAFTKQVFGKQ